MSKQISCILSVLFIVVSMVNGQTIGEQLDRLPVVYADKRSNLETIDSIRAIKALSTDSYIKIRDSVRSVETFVDVKNKLLLNSEYCLNCGITGFSIYDFEGNFLARWSLFYEGAKFHHLSYYYHSGNKATKYELFVGCLKGEKCKWYHFSKKLFDGPTFDKTPKEFNQMIKEIIENRSKTAKKSRKIDSLKGIYTR